MANRYDTGNAVGSADPRDLFDNSIVIDEFANSSSETAVDRLGETRRTIVGLRADVAVAIGDAGYTGTGVGGAVENYAAGIEITQYNQIVRDTNGEFWKVTGATDLPYTTTGAGLPEGGTFVSVGDFALRQDLADPAQGGGLVSVDTVSGASQSLANALNSRTVFSSTIAELKTLPLADGSSVYLLQNGRAGEFLVKAGTPPSDPQEGVYIVLNNGNYAERIDKVNITPEQFGATGDNTTNDWVSALAAFNFAKANNKKILFNGSKTYYLGAFPDSGQEIKFNIDVDDMRVETNGCGFRVDVSLLNDPASSNQVLFQNTQASNTWVGDFKAIGDQIQKTPSRIGFLAFNIHNETDSSSGITLGNIYGEKALAAIQATTSDPSLYRHSGVKAGYIENIDAYYGINCANNADDFTGFSIYTTKASRSYFVYGVSNHKGTIHSVDHDRAADVLIARYVRDTSNIDLIYKSENDLSADQSVRGQFVTDATDAQIENVTIKMDVQKSNTTSATLSFIAYDSTGGNLQATTTNTFKNWSVSGTTNSNENVSLIISSGMTGSARSNIKISKELFKSTKNTKGYIFNVHDGAQTATADADNDLELDFKIRGVTFGAPQIAKLTVSAFNNGTSSDGEYFFRELLIRFRAGTDGTVTIDNTSVVSTFTGGSLGPSLSVNNQGVGSYSLKAKINNYTNANRFVKGNLELYAFAEAV